MLAGVCALGIVLNVTAALGLLERARQLAKSTMDLSNLNGIARAMFLYHDHYGRFPDDLRRLVDEGNDPHLFLSPFGKGGAQVPASRPYAGAVDYRHVPLYADAPKDLVWMWEDPGLYRGEGGWVIRFSGRGEWVDPSELVSEVARSYEWVLSHGPGPATASAPARKTN
jgi:hypothetical protein